MTSRKPPKLICKVNKDYSVSIVCRGKVVHKCISTYSTSPIQSAESFLKGWFGENPVQAAWKF